MQKVVIYKEDAQHVFDLLVQGYVLSMQVLKDTGGNSIYVLFLDDSYLRNKGASNV